MHPVFIVVLIACAGWFFAVTAMAGRGIGARIGFAILGVVEFAIVSEVLTQILKNQDFFRRALRAGPDIGPIVTYIVLPSVVVVFLSGLWLKKVLSRPPSQEEKG
jgi:hypothetical protein